MVGQITYTEDQILFVLRLTLEKVKGAVILTEYKKRFNKTLTASQLRYVKSKYGHDPEFGTALINGTLPSSGGNRKTAPSKPRGNTTVAPSAKNFNNSATHTPNVHSLAPFASASHHHQPDTHIPPPSTTFSSHSQQNTQIQSPPQPGNHSQPGMTLALPGMPAVARPPEKETPAWDPVAHPYGYQPVLEYYKILLGDKSAKRKHSDFHETAKEERSSGDAAETQTIDPKRLKLESPMILPKVENAADEAVFLSQTQTPDNTESTDMYQGPDADKLLDELLKQIDAETMAQEPTMPSVPTTLTQPTPSTVAAFTTAAPSVTTMQATPHPQATQMDFYSPYNYGLADCGMETVVSFSDPSSDASKPSLIFSETDTNPSWSPNVDGADNNRWGNASNLPTYALPTPTDFDPAVDPTVTSYMDPALQGSLSSGGNVTTESQNQWGNATDVGITSSLENQPGGQSNAEAFMGFDWDQMLPFDGNIGSYNDEFHHYPLLE